MGEIHQNEMEEAYKKATEEYMKLHPEAKEIELKYDPKKLLEGLSKEKAKKKAAPPQPAIPGVMNCKRLFDKEKILNSFVYIFN